MIHTSHKKWRMNIFVTLMLLFLIPFLFSKEQTHFHNLTSIPKTSFTISESQYTINTTGHYHFPNIRHQDGIQITDIANQYRLFAFFHLSGIHIGYLLIDGERTYDYSTYYEDYVMISVDANSTISFQFYSSYDSYYASQADLWLLPKGMCDKYSVGEYGGINKAFTIPFNDSLLQDDYPLCVFSPSFVDSSHSVQFGFQSNQVGTFTANLYSNSIDNPAFTVDVYDDSTSYYVESGFFTQYTAFSVIQTPSIVFRHDPTSYHNEAFFNENCVSQYTRYCSGTECTPAPYAPITQLCEIHISTPVDPMNLVYIGSAVSVGLMIIIFIIVGCCRYKQSQGENTTQVENSESLTLHSESEAYQQSNSQPSSNPLLPRRSVNELYDVPSSQRSLYHNPNASVY